MAEVFRTVDVALLLEKKYVVILGSSVQRCMYKDLVCVLQLDQFLTDEYLRRKEIQNRPLPISSVVEIHTGERTFLNDELLEGGKFSQMTNGTDYREVRQYVTEYHRVKFYFITRCYSNYVEKVLNELKEASVKPDVLIINSCLWDITRYGNVFIKGYTENLYKLMKRLHDTIPEECLVLWNSTLPVSKEAKGGVIIPECEAMTSTLRLDINLANHLATKIVHEAGYDVIDFQFYLRNELHRRAEDGIHWDMTAHRRFTNLIMTHIVEAWGCDLPNNSCVINPSLLKDLQMAITEDVPRRPVSARPIAKAKRRNTFMNRNHDNQLQSEQRVTINKPFEWYNGPVRNHVVQDYTNNIINNQGQHLGYGFNGPVQNVFLSDDQEHRRYQTNSFVQQPWERGPVQNGDAFNSSEQQNSRPISIFNLAEHSREHKFHGPVHEGFAFDRTAKQNTEPFRNLAAVQAWESRFNGPVCDWSVFNHTPQQNLMPLRNNVTKQSWENIGNNNFQSSERPVRNDPVKIFGDPNFHQSIRVNPIFQQEICHGAMDIGPHNFRNKPIDYKVLSHSSNHTENFDHRFPSQPFQPPCHVGMNSDIRNSQLRNHFGFGFNDENAGISQKKMPVAGDQTRASRLSNRPLKDKNIYNHQNQQFHPVGHHINGNNVWRQNTVQKPSFRALHNRW